jgi:CheY-like chemotaxis protein
LSELAEEEQPKELSPWPARRVTGLKPGEPEYRILVVEDHKENRLLMESLGLVVKEAADGEAGVAQWEAWQPHLIWMDMRMPGMDGYEATRRIKATEQGQRTKVIALTASRLRGGPPQGDSRGLRRLRAQAIPRGRGLRDA